jgi:hypothetical protein
LFNKIAGSDFERTQCGPEGVEPKDGGNTPGSTAIEMKQPLLGAFLLLLNLWRIRKKRYRACITGLPGAHRKNMS